YWPWVQPIRSYVQQQKPEQLHSEMGEGAADIAEIIAELHAKLPELETPPELEPGQARFRLFDSITNFLKNAAQNQPLMLVLDDLHWSDKPSLLLLQFLTRRLANCRLLVIGCYRDVELSRQHPLSESLAVLSREPVFRRQTLRGLNQEDTGPFVEATTGVQVPHELADALYSHTEGNPFFLNEVIRLLADQGELVEQVVVGPRGIRVPEGVREVIGRRLNRLSQQCNRVLKAASIVGRDFYFGLLNALVDDSEERDLLEAVEEAVRAFLIEEVPGAGERYRFTHALIHETLAEELTISRKVRLHARIAEALEELYGANVETHAAELTHHFAEAEAVLGPEKLVRYSMLAGGQALAAYAYEEALTYFQRALVAKGVPLSGSDVAEDEEAAELLAGLGHAMGGTHERPDTAYLILILTRAFEYYARSGDLERAVAIAAHSQLAPNMAGELIAQALELVSPDTHEYGFLLSRYIMPTRGDYGKAQDAFHHAVAIAQRDGDIVLQMEALVSMACVDFNHSKFEVSLERNREAVRLAEMVDRPAAEAHSHYDLMHVLYGMGELAAAARHANAALVSAERSGVRTWMACAMESNENVCSAKGDWQAAREFCERGLAISPRDTSLLGCRAIIDFQVGDFAAGEQNLQRLLDVLSSGQSGPPTPSTLMRGGYTHPAVTIPIIARISGGTASLDVAEKTAGFLLSWPLAVPAAVRSARIGLALIAVVRGDSVSARELYDASESMRGTMSPQSPHGPGLAADRILGLLAQTIGDLDQAAGHFEEALAFCRKAGYRPELAWTCCDYAEALARRNGPGDGPTANSLLEESSSIAGELGMRPLLDRVAALQERTETQIGRSPHYPDGLTQREVEVLRLISAGKTDREIGDELFISVRTVGYHVGNILNKTTSNNRAEAAAYASRQGLI
ncbi:MAG: helix-turn-helix transcriptional regulator, partial [Dehalococcoidia bacterium]